MDEDSPKDIWGDENFSPSEEELLVKDDDDDDLQSAPRQDTEEIAETPLDAFEGNDEASYSHGAFQSSQSSSTLGAKEDDLSMIIFSTPEKTSPLKIPPLIHKARAQNQEKYRRRPSLSELSHVRRCGSGGVQTPHSPPLSTPQLKFDDDDEIKENKPIGVIKEQGSRLAIDSKEYKSVTEISEEYLMQLKSPEKNEGQQTDMWDWYLDLSASMNYNEINNESAIAQSEEIQKMFENTVLEDNEKERNEVTVGEDSKYLCMPENFPNMHSQNVPEVNFDSEIEPPTQVNPDLFSNEPPCYTIEDSDYSSEEEIAPSQVSTRTLTLRDFPAGSSKEVSTSNYDFPADQDDAQAIDKEKLCATVPELLKIRKIGDITERNMGSIIAELTELRKHPDAPSILIEKINAVLGASGKHNLPHIVKLHKQEENQGATELFETQGLCFLAEAGIELPGSNFEEIPQTSNEDIPQIGIEDIPQIGIEDIPQMGIEDIPQMGIEDIPQMGIEDIPQMGIEDIPQISIEDIPQIAIEDTLQTGVENTLQSAVKEALQCVVEETLRNDVEDIPHSQVRETPLTSITEVPQINVEELQKTVYAGWQQTTTGIEQFSNEMNLDNFFMNAENFVIRVDGTPPQCPIDELPSSKTSAIVELPESIFMKKPSEILQVKEFLDLDGVNSQIEAKDSSEHIQEIIVCQEQVLLETDDIEKCHAEEVIHPDIHGSKSEENPKVLEEQKLPPLDISKHEELNMSPKKAEVIAHDKYPNPVTSASERSKQTINNVAFPSNIPTPGVGTFSSLSELNIILKSLGLSVDDEELKSFSSLPADSGEKVVFNGVVSCNIVIRNNTVFQQISALDQGKIIQNMSEVEVSPANSSSTTLSTKTYSFGSIPSGDIADISCSISSKSLSSNTSSNASQPKIRKSILSQEAKMGLLEIKTSTQKSNATSFKASGASIFEDSQLEINKGKQDELYIDANVSQSKKPIMSNQLDNKKPSPFEFRRAVVVLTRLEDLPSHALMISQSAPAALKSKRGRKRKSQSSLVPATVYSSSSSDKPTKKGRKHSGKSEINNKQSAQRSTKVFQGATKSCEDDKSGKNMMESESCNNRNSFDVSESTDESSTEVVPYNSIIPGVRVMARWKDGYYYPGVVQRKDSEGRWWIDFDDGLHSVNAKNLIKISIFEPGTNVLAHSANDYYESGVIKSHFRDGEDCGYVIEHPTGINKRYLRSDVILSSEQAKVIIESRPAAPASLTINLDNIVDGKRKRKLSQASDVKSKSFRYEKQKTKADSNLDSTESSASKSVLPEKYIIQKVKAQLKKSGRRQNSKYNLPRNENQATSSDIGSNQHEMNPTLTDSVSIRSGNIFMRYAFLLSNALRNPDVSNHSTSNTDSECSELQDAHQPFDKEALCRTIIASAGIVLETFDEAMKSNRTILLLANGPLRTIKYIQCVAANIPCIKHHWIQDCLSTKRLVPITDYLLPTGMDIIRNQLVEWHGRTDVFDGLKVVLAAGTDDDFVTTWTPVLLTAKANLVKTGAFPTSVVPGMSFEVDLIIANASCPEEVLRDARRWNTPIVSSEWMIQCIITGIKLPFHSHERFLYNA